MVNPWQIFIWVWTWKCRLNPEKPNGFADQTIPFLKWLAIIGGIPHFQTYPYFCLEHIKSSWILYSVAFLWKSHPLIPVMFRGFKCWKPILKLKKRVWSPFPSIKISLGPHGIPHFATHQDFLETPTYVRLKFFAEGAAVDPWWPHGGHGGHGGMGSAMGASCLGWLLEVTPKWLLGWCMALSLLGPI